MTFPVSPSNNDTHTEPDGYKYQYSFGVWDRIEEDFMRKTIYDPGNISGDIFDRVNHINQIQISDVQGLELELGRFVVNYTTEYTGYTLPTPTDNDLVFEINGLRYIHYAEKNLNLLPTYSAVSPNMAVSVLHIIQPSVGVGFTLNTGSIKKGKWDYSTALNAINEIVLMAPVGSFITATCQVL
jgi:hypothetical protein